MPEQNKPTTPKIRIHPVLISNLSTAEMDEIWEFAFRYTDTTREIYERSLRLKQKVYLMRDRERGNLIGLGAVQVTKVTFEGRPYLIIFGGNVLIDEAYRGLNVIQRLGLQNYLSARLHHPFTPIYFLFDTFSYKSFLMLSRNLREFYPRRDRPTPEWILRFVDFLAEQRYGEAWDPLRGIVVGTGDRKLRDWVVPVATKELKRPTIGFFVERNPGFRKGDLLVCIAPLNLGNIRSMVGNMFRRILQKRRAKAQAEGTKREEAKKGG